MTKKTLAIALILALACACAAAVAECPKIALEDYPTVDGSTATLPLSYLLMQTAVGVDEDAARAGIRHHKTSESFNALECGDSDLLLVYEPTEEAWLQGHSDRSWLEYQPIGLDALVFLINDGNPLDSLTHEQILDIYTGKATNWSQLGGDDLEIVPYQRIENSGSQVMMLAQVMRDTPIMPAPTELRPSEMGELVDGIASYRNTANSIGYSVYYYINNMYMKEGIKLLSVNGVPPTNESIASGSYPYRQPFYAVIRADAPEDSPARLLYNWLATAEGRQLVEDAGYVAIAAE